MIPTSLYSVVEGAENGVPLKAVITKMNNIVTVNYFHVSCTTIPQPYLSDNASPASRLSLATENHVNNINAFTQKAGNNDTDLDNIND
mmetsp:Transcript_51959/g.62484  ORF Transcript_51959/g.62484 Transcript_51959/m.62484 type:complete len:88 (+) Transcript_51959:214-477(+)|eukprot:CAMPEP_0172508420 /NCGR_PEP_ID=MMETSP1066-20121228/211824_1 /TAXON_ID=671091 /ORGANISM="Coscinodiscus wailesii, Strain CCMP2513" /LENGTH=87 /DNA_ID=CAMNT_0013286393 /DNA_START=175 /DNA_END=438 /DNA_ORIENTATION=+